MENSTTKFNSNVDNGQLYIMNVFLHDGRKLSIKDPSGSSDPYVKFFYKTKPIYRSHTIFNNLNPRWDEKFVHVIDDINTSLNIEVYDYDRFSNDDFMGFATLDLKTLDERPSEHIITLEDKKKNPNLGYLIITISITPAKDDALKQAAIARFSSQEEDSHESRSKTKPSIRKVHIVLVEAKLTAVNNPLATDAPDTFVKFKVGEEKCKSKIVYKSYRPQWLEQFTLHTRDDKSKNLDVAIMDLKRDSPIGKCSIDLSLLRPGETEKRWYALDNGVSEILLTLSHTGKLATRTVTTADKGEGLPTDLGEGADTETSQNTVNHHYDVTRTLKNIWDIGHLTVKVIKARGLAAKDILNSSDPFCVVELVNSRLETHTEHKTRNPEWNTTFTFYVADIHTCLEVSVYDEDRYMKSEFMGKVAIPLLNIKNGEQTWYQLKDERLRKHVQGEILLEMSFTYNPVRAVVATFLPPERKYGIEDEKFRVGRMIRNVERVNRFIIPMHDLYKYWQRCLSWENPQLSFTAFVLFLCTAYYLNAAMIPLGVLLLFLYVYVQRLASLNMDQEPGETEFEVEYTDDKENWRYIRRYVQEKNINFTFIQNLLELVASMMEKCKNILEFKQPFVSWIAVISMIMATILLYVVPFRYLAMAWVIKKFTRKLRRPHAVPSNEVLDFIARAPSDIELRMYHGYK